MTKQAMFAGLSVLTACVPGRSASTPPKALTELSVRIENPSAVPIHVLSAARVTAEAILERARVRLRWSWGEQRRTPVREATGCDGQPRSRQIVVRFEEELPRGLPAAMAMAHPFASGGVQISVYHRRVLAHFIRAASSARVLAHVLVHEIVHILQGSTEHGESDLMRPRWSMADLHRMATLPFQLSAEDIRRIAAGYDVWNRCATRNAVTLQDQSK